MTRDPLTLFLFLSLALAGCAGGGGGGGGGAPAAPTASAPSPAATGIEALTVPSAFDYAGSREVEVDVLVTRGGRALAQVPVLVCDPDGALIAEAQTSGSGRAILRLSLAARHRSLRVLASVVGQPAEAEVAVVGDFASARFDG